MKVFQGSLDGRNNYCVAAKSWKAAHEAIVGIEPNTTLHYLQTMWSVTGNDEQIAAAMSEPGTVFGQMGRSPREPYKPLRVRGDAEALRREWHEAWRAARTA